VRLPRGPRRTRATRSHGGNRRWQPSRKSASYQATSPPSQGQNAGSNPAGATTLPVTSPVRGISQNPSVTLRILFEPVQASRWVDRHGHAPGEKRAEEDGEEILLGPEDEPDRISPPEPTRRETGGDRHRARLELPVGDRPLAPVGLLEKQVDAPGVGLGLTAQDDGART